MLSKELFKETPKHLIKFHDTEAEQYAYCESIGCYFNCEHCVNYSESIPLPTKKPIKERILKSEHTPTKWDNLSKKATNKPDYKHDHPLYELILQLFTTNGENK